MRNDATTAASVRMPPRTVAAGRRTRLFYVGMATAIVVLVFAGFSRTYFLKSYFGSPDLSLLLHIHGVVFTTWVLFLLAQTTLVATGRTYIHRRMGVAGAVLAVLLVVVGSLTAILRVKGGSTPVPGVSGLSFLAIPLFDMLLFAILVGAALYFRRRLEAHKRLMLLATITLLGAPIARFHWGGPPTFFGLSDLFIVAMVGYDLITRRKIHPATLWGGLLIVASQPLRLMISGTPAWLAFAGWLTR
jgi:hypothetical protein